MAILCPTCPHCFTPPVLMFAEQAWCQNDECTTMTWNPSKVEGGLLDEEPHVVDLTALFGPQDKPDTGPSGPSGPSGPPETPAP